MFLDLSKMPSPGLVLVPGVVLSFVSLKVSKLPLLSIFGAWSLLPFPQPPVHLYCRCRRRLTIRQHRNGRFLWSANACAHFFGGFPPVQFPPPAGVIY